MEFWIDALNLGLILAIYAIALNVVLGYAGQLSVAPAGLGGVGGFLAAYFAILHGWAFGPALVAGVVGALLVGLVLGVPALRLGTDYLILLTLAFATIIPAVILAIPALGGPDGLIGVPPVTFLGPLRSPGQYLRLVLVVTALTGAFCWRMTASPFGRVLRSLREDEAATESVGKHVVAFKILTFALTAAVMGAAGVMTVYYLQSANSVQFGFDPTVSIVAAVIIGGMGNFLGAAVGALVVSFISPVLQRTLQLSPTTAGTWQLVAYGALLILVVRVRPDGLIPEGSVLRLPRMPWRRGAPALDDADASPPVTRPHLTVPAAEPGQGGPMMVAEAGVDQVAPGDPVLTATGLVKHFGGIHAVNGLDLELPLGQITALVGPNGAGKTTVFNLLTGRIRPDAGTVTLRGRDITGMPPHETARLGLVRSFQDVRTLGRMSLLDNVRLGVPDQPGERLMSLYLRPREVRNRERETTRTAIECLEFVGLEARAHELAGGLGYGDQKRLAIARILATGADVLLVDEPAAGIDRAHLEPVLEVIGRLREGGKTICLVEHNLDVVARLADRVLFMEGGRVSAEGTMQEITKIDRLAEVYFGHV